MNSFCFTLPNFSLTMLLVYTVGAFSQTGGIIKGTVINPDGEPAVSIGVKLKTMSLLALTDKNGYFLFENLPELHDSLIISAVDFKKISREIILAKNDTTVIPVIQLEYRVNELQTVEINGREGNLYKSDYSYFGNKTQSPALLIPQSISAVTKELIEDKMALTLKDVADGISGMSSYSGYDEYTLRGFRAENAYNINGLRGYNTTYSSSMLVNIERVEVIKGPTASLYGNCDPGGSINFVTKKPLNTPRTEFNLLSGSYNHLRAQADVTSPLNKTKTLLYRFNAGYDNTNSFRTGVFARSFEVAPSLSFIPNDKFRVNADFSLSYINTVLDRGQPGIQGSNNLYATPISLSLIQPGDHLHETDMASNITSSYRIAKNLVLNSGYLNYCTMQNAGGHILNDYINPYTVSLGYTSFKYNTLTNTLTNYLTYKINTGKVNHQLLAGFDYIISNVNLGQNYYELPDQFGNGSGIVGTFDLKHPQHSSRPVSTYLLSDFGDENTNVDGTMYHTKGMYLQDQLDLDKWTLLLSMRQEFYKGDSDDSVGSLKENVFLPRVGIVYSVKPNLSAYVTYNSGFDPFEVSTNVQVFNQPFKPITSQLYEAGIKATCFANKLSSSLAFYQLTVQNVATNAGDISNPELFVQQGENRSRGIEAEANGNIFPCLSVSLSYAYSVARVTHSSNPAEIGRIAQNAPCNTSGSYIKYTLCKGNLKGFGLSAGHSSVSSRTTLDPDVKLPGYFVLNGGVHYKYAHFKIALNVSNIANKIYWVGAYDNTNKWPGRPRNFMVNLGYEF
jgi:iron complex outermembrane recepter protein